MPEFKEAAVKSLNRLIRPEDAFEAAYAGDDPKPPDRILVLYPSGTPRTFDPDSAPCSEMKVKVLEYILKDPGGEVVDGKGGAKGA